MSERAPISPRSPRAALEPEQLPPPPKRSRGAHNPLVVAGNAIFTVILLLFVVAGGGYFYAKQALEATGPLADDKIVNIPRTAGTADIADILQREGVIPGAASIFDANRLVFFGGVAAVKAQKKDLKYGEYLFPKAASMRDVIDTIVAGKVVQHALTIPEGLTSEQIVARLLENDVLSGPVGEIPREGTLLPETYRFERGTTREQVIQRMQQQQRKLLAEIWERRSPDVPVRSMEQLVTLASIVEKETGRPDERTRVAAVFANRLQKKMRLQSDPTIIYGLVGGKGTLGRQIKRSEIQQPTPYNTYVIDGLPPGPIANPGRASLEATANPARTRELYFVADGTGGHAFTETYDQHQRNVAKLRTLERQQAIDTAEPEDATATATPPEAPPAAAEPPARPASAGAKKRGGSAPARTPPTAQNSRAPTVQR
jgi:UPF0755 protein